MCDSGKDAPRNLRVGHSERTTVRLDEDRTAGIGALDFTLE